MEIIEVTIPERVVAATSGFYSLSFPSKLKVQTTGPGAEVLLDAGPESGKVWDIDINIVVKVRTA